MRLIPVTSSMLAALGYNPSTEDMVAQFHSGNKLFKYLGVPSGVFVSVITSPSQGKAFDKFVKKGGFNYTEITAGDLDVL